MSRFSANLGFLWTELPLSDAIRAAKAAGFAAVELHWPYDTPAQDVRAALDETGLPVLALNTRRGDVAAGEYGVFALVGREDEALAAISQSIAYAGVIGAGAIHVMAGNANGAEARETFVRNLKVACEMARGHDLTILIEPLNGFDAPNYFLRDTAQAEQIIHELNAPNLRLMFDCYHVGRTEGQVGAQLEKLIPIIGHIQFASVPNRGAPDQGEVDYKVIFKQIDALGWDRPLGAEYKPLGLTGESLNWMTTLG